MWYYNCQVIKAGAAEDGVVYIAIRNLDPSPAFDYWFKAESTVADRMLSTALTAISTGNTVEIGLYEEIKMYATINRLYLHNY